MPKFRVTSPDGKTYEVNAPEGATQEDAIAYVQREQASPPSAGAAGSDDLSGFEQFQGPGESLARGAIPGFRHVQAAGTVIGDRLGRGMDAVGIRDYPAADQPPISYDDAYKKTGERFDRYDEAHPVISTGLQVTGGVGSPILGRVGSGAQAGTNRAFQMLGRQTPRYVGYGANAAGQGSVAAMGSAEGDDGGLPTAGDVAEAGASGGAIGGAFGTAIPGAAELGAKTAGKIAQPFIDRMAQSGPANAAARRAMQVLQEEGLTTEQALAKLRARGPEAILADISPGMTGLAEDAAQIRGPTQSKAIRTLTSRQGTIMSPSGQGDRLSKSVFDNLSGANFRGTVDELSAARSETARPLYKALYDKFALRPIRAPVIERLLTRPDFQKGLKAGIKDAMDEAAITGDDVAMFNTYIEGANLDDPNLVLKSIPNIRILDAAKQGIDDLLRDGSDGIRHPVTNKLTKRGMRLEQMRQAVVKELDDLTTVDGKSMYKEARDAWAGPSRSIDLMQRGREFVKDGSADELADLMGTMSASEKEFYRIGVAKELTDTIEKSADGMDKARKIFGNEMMRGKLEAIFPTREAFNSFRKQVLTEINFANTKRQVIDNSATMRRQSGQQQLAMDPTGPMIEGAQGNYGGAAANFVRQGIAALRAPPASTARELAPMFSRDPLEQQLFLRSIDQRGQAQQLTADQRRRMADFLSRTTGPGVAALIGENQ